MPRVQGYALMANFRAGYKRSFRCCFLVFRFSSCLLSLRRMARVFLGRRSRGLYFLPCLQRHTEAELRHCSEPSSCPSLFSLGLSLQPGAQQPALRWESRVHCDFCSSSDSGLSKAESYEPHLSSTSCKDLFSPPSMI